MQINDLVTLKIDRLSYDGGRGVARVDTDGIVVFVPETAPNELVEVKITVIKKNYAEGELVKVIEPSPHRREAPCPVASKCGGCAWQHIAYDEQVRQKEAFLKRALRAFTDYNYQFIAAKSEFHYRNRIQLQVGKDRQFGFFAKKSRSLISITECLIAEPELLAKFKLPSKVGSKIELAKGSSNQITVRDLDEEDSVFTQVNSAQNIELQNVVVDFFAKLKTQPNYIIDLYCGDANLSFPLLEKFPTLKLTGVEYSGEAISRAKLNPAHNPMRSEFIKCDTLKFLKKLQPTSGLSILVDPPRAGLGAEVCSEVLRLKPENIVYVSCNLATLERDLKTLRATYRLDRVVGIDMFPQTEYVESVCLLAKI